MISELKQGTLDKLAPKIQMKSKCYAQISDILLKLWLETSEFPLKT